MGTPVVALCGKVWVPSRAPEKFPVCPECKEVWESLKDDAGADSGPTESTRGDDAAPLVPGLDSGVAGARGLGHGHPLRPGRRRR